MISCGESNASPALRRRKAPMVSWIETALRSMPAAPTLSRLSVIARGNAGAERQYLRLGVAGGELPNQLGPVPVGQGEVHDGDVNLLPGLAQELSCPGE